MAAVAPFVKEIDEEPNPDMSFPEEPELEPVLLGAGRNVKATSQHFKRVKSYQGMHTPYYLAEMLAHEDPGVAIRVFLLDNSGSTSNCDGHMLARNGQGHLQSVASTRWEEICATALDQAEWNATAGVRTEFILLNPPCPENPQEGRDFAVVNPQGGNVKAQVGALAEILQRNGPRGVTPLTLRLQQLQARLQKEVTDGRRILLTIVTDGLPTAPTSGKTTELDKASFVNQLRSFTESFNSFVVIRLATDDDSSVDYYNQIDEELELPLDILDDLSGEAKEVHDCGNGWFAYTPMVHKIREGGTSEKLFDLLDERALKLPEISKFMELLFRRSNDAPFPRDPKQLLILAKEINARSDPVYDARLNAMASPLNIKLLARALGQTKSQRLKALPARIMRSVTCSKHMPRE